MLRFKILVSIIPLAVAGFFAREQLVASIHPCIATANASVQIAPTPWQAQRRVSFTSDPAEANVRVQIVDSPETADFAVVDDGETDEAGACNGSGSGPTELVGITERSSATPTVIYLSRDTAADYHVFVQSKTFTLQEAAALVVSARAGRPQQVAGSL